MVSVSMAFYVLMSLHTNMLQGPFAEQTEASRYLYSHHTMDKG